MFLIIQTNIVLEKEKTGGEASLEGSQLMDYPLVAKRKGSGLLGEGNLLCSNQTFGCKETNLQPLSSCKGYNGQNK
jgi:hypothetical protein